VAPRPTLTMKQRAREAAATALLEAAEHVAAERGIDQTSIAAIAERAQVAVGTLYNYFPDREALLAALFKLRRDELVPRIIAAAATASSTDQPLEQRLESFLREIARTFEGFRRFCRVAMSADVSNTPIKGRVGPGGKSIVLQTVTDGLTAILRPIYGARSEEYARMMFGSLRALIQLQLEKDLPIETVVAPIIAVFLRGMPR
jgi:AcrR family transcriptional regulator